MKRLDGLQALRGVAAAMVVTDHAMRAAIIQGHSFVALEDFAGTIGRMGVNIFFILSGFIMTYTTRETQLLPPLVRTRTFLARRVARLVPLYWLATAATLAIGTLEGTVYRVGTLVTSLLFLPNFADSGDWRMPPIVGVGWTLNYESLFYLIFAGSLLLPRRLGLAVSIGVIALLTGGGAIALHHVDEEPWRRIITFYAFRNMVFFAIGIVIAIVLHRAPAAPSQRAFWLGIAIIAVTLSGYLVFGITEGVAAWSVFSAVSCTLVVILAARDAALPATALNRVLLHLGEASYSIYLFHALLMEQLAAAIAGDFGVFRGAVFAIAATLACLMLGSVVHSAVEVPLGAMLRRPWRVTPARRHSVKSAARGDTRQLT